MFNRIFRRILSFFPVQDIGDGAGNVFFYRYTLARTRLGNVYLHEFLRGDLDRCLHDHPWSFVTIVLRGGYREFVTPDAARCEKIRVRQPDDDGFVPTSVGIWRRPGSILYRPAEFAHRIEIDPRMPRPWSLVFTGPKKRLWGFHTNSGWKSWIPGANPDCGGQ